jgi:hypothetical protein
VRYPHRVDGDGIYIQHSEVTKEGEITVVVVDEDTLTYSLMIVLPEFHLSRNSLTKEDCTAYLNLIIDKYVSIRRNVKDEDYFTRYLKRVDGVLYHYKLSESKDYIPLLRIKADKILEDYDKQAMNPISRIVSGIKSSISGRPDPIAMLREMANKESNSKD